MGRPKKTPEKDFPPDWEAKIMSLYEVGGCDVEARCELGCISEDLFYRLLEEDENFSLTIKKGRCASESWWRKMGRTGLQGGRVNTGMYALQMRNRFNWYDANKQGDTIVNLGEKFEGIASAISKLDSGTD